MPSDWEDDDGDEDWAAGGTSGRRARDLQKNLTEVRMVPSSLQPCCVVVRLSPCSFLRLDASLEGLRCAFASQHPRKDFSCPFKPRIQDAMSDRSPDRIPTPAYFAGPTSLV